MLKVDAGAVEGSVSDSWWRIAPCMHLLDGAVGNSLFQQRPVSGRWIAVVDIDQLGDAAAQKHGQKNNSHTDGIVGQ